MAKSCYRIPYILGTDQVDASGTVNIAAGTSRLMAEAEYRNDTPYSMEIYGIGFSLVNAASSAADQDYSDVAIRVVDVARNQPWTQSDQGDVPIATLLDLAGNAPTLADLFAFNGCRWQFRYPFLMPPSQKIAVRIRNLLAAAATRMDVVLLGALLVDASGRPDHSEALDRLARAIPYGDFQPYRMNAGGVLGYCRVPYVMSGATGSIASNQASPTRMREDLFRNQSPFPLHVYELGFSLAGATGQFPTQNYRDVAIRVSDPFRNQDWSKVVQRVATLLKYHGNRMSIGQGPVWHGVKWDLGPGTLLPPGAHYQIDVQGLATANVNLTVSVIGDMLVPIPSEGPFAETFQEHLSAIPQRW